MDKENTLVAGNYFRIFYGGIPDMEWNIFLGNGSRHDSGRRPFANVISDKGEHRIWRRNSAACNRGGLWKCKNSGNLGIIFDVGCSVSNDIAGIKESRKKNRTSVSAMSMLRLFVMFAMVKKRKKRWKASFTVEAAMICPFLCLVLCAMLLKTVELYQMVDTYTEQLKQREEGGLSSADLIRLEAVAEELF